MAAAASPQACAGAYRDLAGFALPLGAAADFADLADFVAFAAFDVFAGLVGLAVFVALVGVAADFLAVCDVFLAPPAGAAGCTPQS